MAVAETPPAEDAPQGEPVPEPVVEAKPDEKEKDKEPALLDLVSLTPTRRLCRIPTKKHPEGETYELRLVDDFGIEMQQQLLAQGRQFQKLMGSDEVLKEAEVERMRFLLDSIFDKVLDAPMSVKEDISDTAKNRVIQAFTWAPVLGQQETQFELIRRLVDRGDLEQEKVDKILDDMRRELEVTPTGES